jgi:hypothetical protein
MTRNVMKKALAAIALVVMGGGGIVSWCDGNVWSHRCARVVMLVAVGLLAQQARS